MHRRFRSVLLATLVLIAIHVILVERSSASAIPSSFTAQVEGWKIVIRWTTSSEINNAGFNIIRSEYPSGPFSTLNVSLIPGCGGGCPSGASYIFEDLNATPGKTYFYFLETVDINGVVERFSPVTVTFYAYQYYFPSISQDNSQLCVPYPPLDWDPRLGPGGLPHLENVRIIPANVMQGQKYWRITKVKFENIDESGNDHSIYATVLDEHCKRLYGTTAHLTSVGGLSEFLEERSPSDWCNCNFAYPMYGDGYAIHIETLYPSDMIEGMIMPMKRHVNYRITFQLTTKP